MISYDAALQIIRETALAKTPGTETVTLEKAAGRICAEDIHAGLDIQPFDNSAMDGFAVRLDDFDSAPVHLKKSGIIAAGQDARGLSIAKGACWQIMTGAMLPEGTAAIIPVENAVPEGDRVLFKSPPKAGQHIRHAGEDFRKGALLLPRGERITAAHILPLATAGIAHLTVFKKQKILYIPTGTEIIDILGTPLETGQIYNSNRFYACSFLAACDADVTVHDIIRDDPAPFTTALARVEKENFAVVVSSGAVSAGSFDFVRESLEDFGATILFHKINLKPGKPNLLATLPSGPLYFGLPGNPVATAVGLRFFVAEALRIARAQKPETPVYARAANAFPKKNGLHMVLKGRLDYRADGTVTVDLLDGQESFRVSPFLAMNCWVHLPQDTDSIAPGDVVETYPLLP